MSLVKPVWSFLEVHSAVPGCQRVFAYVRSSGGSAPVSSLAVAISLGMRGRLIFVAT